MKQLILIRHAKSDWSDTGLADFDRGLSKRGKNQIKEMGKILKKLDFHCDIIFCSPAKRAMETLKGLGKKYKNLKDMEVNFYKEIYDYHLKGSQKIVELVKKADDKYDSIALIGHNNAFDEIVESITVTSGLHLETLAIITINFDIKKWKEMEKNGIVTQLISPTD